MSHYLVVVFGIWRWRCSAYCGQSTSTIDILNLNVVNSYADIVWQWLLFQSNTPKYQYHRPIWSPVHFNSLHNHNIRSASVTVCYLPHTLWTTLMSALKNNVFRLFHTISMVHPDPENSTRNTNKAQKQEFYDTSPNEGSVPPASTSTQLAAIYVCCT